MLRETVLSGSRKTVLYERMCNDGYFNVSALPDQVIGQLAQALKFGVIAEATSEDIWGFFRVPLSLLLLFWILQTNHFPFNAMHLCMKTTRCVPQMKLRVACNEQGGEHLLSSQKSITSRALRATVMCFLDLKAEHLAALGRRPVFGKPLVLGCHKEVDSKRWEQRNLIWRPSCRASVAWTALTTGLEKRNWRLPSTYCLKPCPCVALKSWTRTDAWRLLLDLQYDRYLCGSSGLVIYLVDRVASDVRMALTLASEFVCCTPFALAFLTKLL